MAALLSEPVAPPPSRAGPDPARRLAAAAYWLFGGATVRPLAHALGDDQPFFGVALDMRKSSVSLKRPASPNLPRR